MPEALLRTLGIFQLSLVEGTMRFRSSFALFAKSWRSALFRTGLVIGLNNRAAGLDLPASVRLTALECDALVNGPWESTATIP